MSVVQGFGFEISERDGGLKMNASFRLGGHGLPARPLSAAAVPLTPCHPHLETQRAAARTSPELPWSDCHIHTLERFSALVVRIYQHDPSSHGYVLSLEEFQALRRAAYADTDTFRIPQEDVADGSHDSESDSSGDDGAIETMDIKYAYSTLR